MCDALIVCYVRVKTKRIRSALTKRCCTGWFNSTGATCKGLVLAQMEKCKHGCEVCVRYHIIIIFQMKFSASDGYQRHPLAPDHGL